MAKKDYKGMSDEELKAELVSRGFEEADLAELDTKALVKQLKEDDKAVSDAEESDESSQEPTKGEKASSKMKGAVHIIKAIGDGQFEYIRTYSEEDHGEDYEALANGFVKKNSEKGFDTYAFEIPAVSVSFREYDKEKKAQMDRTRNFNDIAEGVAFKNGIPKASITFRA